MTNKEFERAEKLNQEIQDKLKEVKRVNIEDQERIKELYAEINAKSKKLSDLLNA